MSLRFSHSAFPCTPEQKAACALPWGMVLQPLAPLPHPSSHTSQLSPSIARCSSCLAYINPYAQFVRRGWRCAICRAQNEFTHRRYEMEDQRHQMAELVLTDVDYVWVEEDEAAAPPAASDSAEESEEAEAERAALQAYEASRDPTAASYDPSATLLQPFTPAPSASVSPPAYVFVVDLSAEPAPLELLKSALLAALEALPSSVWVGLCVVSARVGVYDLKCSIPTVAYASIRSSAVAGMPGALGLDECPTSLPLHQLLPLDSFLQKLSHCKENLAAAIESLQSHAPVADLRELERQLQGGEGGARGGEEGAQMDPEAGGSASATQQPDAPSSIPASHSRASSSSSAASAVRSAPSSPCGFGGALTALLSYLSSVGDDGFELNARLLCFLTQRPNWGLGALPDRSEGRDQGVDADHLDESLLRPNEGRMAHSGATAASDSHASSSHRVSSLSCADFYRSLGSQASQRGVCIDLYAMARGGSGGMDLATLKFISLLTGGNLMYYPPSVARRDCTLPQDLFRQLRLPQAFRCLLRVRTSPEMHLANVYGHLVPDAGFDNLYHVGGCDARKAYSFDLDFSGAAGFRGGYADTVPVVQVAFSYIAIVPGADGGGDRVEHRLRVMTRQIPLVFFPAPARGVALPRDTMDALRRKGALQAIAELFQAAVPEVMLTLLVQQLIHASLERGLAEARLLLRDWLVGFMLAYHAVHGEKPAAAGEATKGAGGKPDPAASPAPDEGDQAPPSFDLSLSHARSLQFLPRFVCALLKSALLAVDSGSGSGGSGQPHPTSPDSRAYLQVLYAGLEVDYIVKSIYPTLSSYSVLPDAQLESDGGKALPLAQRQSLVALPLHHPVLYLTRSSISGCGDRIFLLDSYHALRVLYRSTLFELPVAREGLLPLPPPASSDLGKALRRAKAQAPYLTPKVVCCTEDDRGSVSGGLDVYASSGKDAARDFFACLLEDEEGGTGGTFSYQTFLDEVAREMTMRLRAEQE